MTIESFIRDTKLGILTDDHDMPKIDTSTLFPKFYFFFKKRRIIKYLIKNGAVLCGSRALKCYKFDGVPVLNRRKCDDWDFLITKDDFLKLCSEYKIYDFDISRPSYHLNKSFATLHGDYGGTSYLFKCHIQLLIVDKLPSYQEVNGIRIVSLMNILNNKIDLRGKGNGKHFEDLNNIMLNIRMHGKQNSNVDV